MRRVSTIPPKPARILITNLHSARNLGDEAILRVTLAGLRQTLPAARIVLSGNDPESWRTFPDVEVAGTFTHWLIRLENGRWRLDAWRLPIVLLQLLAATLAFRWFGRRLLFGSPEERTLLEACYSADLVLSCGGGNFIAYRRFSPFYLLALLSLGFPLMLGKPLAMLPQSVGPVNGWLQRWLSRLVFSRAQVILAREPKTMEFLHTLMPGASSIELSPDLAFGLAEVSPPPGGAPASPADPLPIGVTVINRGAQTAAFTGQAAYETALLEALTQLHRRQPVHIHLFTQCYGPSPDHDDRLATARFHERLQAAGVPATNMPEYLHSADLLAGLAGMRLVVTTRMHAGIFALTQAIPLVMIAYQPKAAGVMHSFNLDEFCLLIDDITPQALLSTILRAIEFAPELRLKLAARQAALLGELEGWPGRLGLA